PGGSTGAASSNVKDRLTTTASAFVGGRALLPACCAGTSGLTGVLAAGCSTRRAKVAGIAPGDGGDDWTLSFASSLARPASAMGNHSGNGSQTGTTTASTGTTSTPTRATRRTAPRSAGPPRWVASQARTPSSAISVICARATVAQAPPTRTLSGSFIGTSP